MNILQQIKDTLRTIRRKKPIKHKPMPILKEPKTTKPKKEKVKKEQIKTIVEGRELSLSRIAQLYNLKPHTVYARYRVGNRGKLLIRPTPRQTKS